MMNTLSHLHIFFEEESFRLLSSVFDGVVGFVVDDELRCVSPIYWMLVLSQTYGVQVFSPIQ